MSLGWMNTSALSNRGWTCGYCGRVVGGNIGYHRDVVQEAASRLMYVVSRDLTVAVNIADL